MRTISPRNWLTLGLLGFGMVAPVEPTVAQTNPPPPPPAAAGNTPTPAPAGAPAQTPGTPAAPNVPAAAATPAQPSQPQAVQAQPGAPAAAPAKIEVVRDNYPDGQVRVEKSGYRDANGNFVNHGAFTWYGPDGQKMGFGEMVNGKRQGHWTRTHVPGDSQLFQGGPLLQSPAPYTSEADFINGELNGLWTVKSANGAIIASWGFLGGKQNGDWIWSSPSGQPEFKTQYVAGKQHGLAQYFDPSGQVANSQTFIDGRQLVRQKFWYPNGVVSCEGTFLTAREKLVSKYDWWQGYADTVFYGYVGGRDRHGKFVWYYPSGQKKIEGEYLLGQITGTWTYYNEDGSVQKTETIPPPDLPKDQVSAATATAGVSTPATGTPAGGTPATGTTPAATPAVTTPGATTPGATGTAPTPGTGTAPTPGVTPEIKPAAGDKPVEKAGTPEPGVDQTTPAAPTVAQVAEVKTQRLKALSVRDDDAPAKPAEKKSPIQLKDE